MSLDLYLTSKIKRQYVGTGVFIRENGTTKELQTIEDVKAHFPDADTSEIKERMYETCEVFSKNITHNLGEMARHVLCDDGLHTLYEMMWRPEEHGFDVVNEKYRMNIAECLSFMLIHRKELEQYNPENGWGSYDTLLKFVMEYSEELSRWDGEETLEIYASR